MLAFAATVTLVLLNLKASSHYLFLYGCLFKCSHINRQMNFLLNVIHISKNGSHFHKYKKGRQHMTKSQLCFAWKKA